MYTSDLQPLTSADFAFPTVNAPTCPLDVELGKALLNRYWLVPAIESIATGTPDHITKQSEAADFVSQLPQMKGNRDRIAKLYENTRIDTRHLAVDLMNDGRYDLTIQERMELFREAAVPLAERVARQALEPVSTDAIGLVVFVSSTGFIAPGIDAELIERLGLRRNVARVTVNFMGCAAAMNGLRVASDHVRAYPHSKALVVCLELSSVNAVFEDSLNDVIIHSIFGDGCAAVVVGASGTAPDQAKGKILIREHLSHLIEGTQDGITLGVRDNGITCWLSKQLPDYIEGIGPIIGDFLTSQGLTQEDIDLWAIHPGGTRIVQKAQSALGLADDQVAVSWGILREYGNMLSVSILFVLEEMARRAREDGAIAPQTGLAFSFSPGVGLEGILFELA